jgi:hypothetical protein
MNPLQKLIDELQRQQNELRARANEAMSTFGPVESYEAGSITAQAINELNWLQRRLKEMGKSMAEIIGTDPEAFVASLQERFGETAITAKIEAGELIAKADHDIQVTAAKSEAKNEAENEFRAQREATEAAESKRADLATSLEDKLGKDGSALAASCISLDDLKADDAKDRETSFLARVNKLTEIGVTPTDYKEAFVDLLSSCPLTADGGRTFDSRVKALEPILAKSKTAKKPGDELEDGPGPIPDLHASKSKSGKRMF